MPGASNSGSNANQSDDLLGLSFDMGGTSSGLSSLNTSTPSSFLPAMGGSAGAFPNTGGLGMTSAAASLPGAFPPMGGIQSNSLQTPSPVGPFPGMGFPQTAVPSAQFQQQPMSMASLTPTNNADALDLFGSSSNVPAAPVLQPDTKAPNGAIPTSNSASNNINNNSNPSLKVCERNRITFKLR